MLTALIHLSITRYALGWLVVIAMAITLCKATGSWKFGLAVGLADLAFMFILIVIRESKAKNNEQ